MVKKSEERVKIFPRIYFFVMLKIILEVKKMPHNRKEEKRTSSAEKNLKDFNRTSEYPVVNRASLKDYDALEVKRWVEENEL